MKELEYVYFTVYHHYTRRSYFPGEMFARLQAMYLVSLSAGGWILFMQAAYLRILKQAWFTTQAGAMFFAVGVYTMMAVVLHKIFIVNERDQKILSKYTERWDNNPNKKRDLVLSFVILSIPYILLMVLKLALPRAV